MNHFSRATEDQNQTLIVKNFSSRFVMWFNTIKGEAQLAGNQDVQCCNYGQACSDKPLIIGAKLWQWFWIYKRGDANHWERNSAKSPKPYQHWEDQLFCKDVYAIGEERLFIQKANVNIAYLRIGSLHVPAQWTPQPGTSRKPVEVATQSCQVLEVGRRMWWSMWRVEHR